MYEIGIKGASGELSFKLALEASSFQANSDSDELWIEFDDENGDAVAMIPYDNLLYVIPAPASPAA